MVAAVYNLKLDTARTGGFSASIDDVTSRLIGNLSFNVGMTEAEQSFAPPSRMTVTLDNIDGAFNPDVIGAEVLTNGDFATWSLDNPSSWTVSGEVGVDPQVSQRAADETRFAFTGSGTGAANFFSSSAAMSITQAALTTGTTYKVEINISAGVFSTGYLTFTGSSIYYHLPGKYTYYFNATSSTFAVTTSGAVDLTIDSISVKPVSLYAMVSEGMLGLFTATPGSMSYLGKLATIEILPGAINRRVVVLTFTDWTLDFLDVEYIPPLYTDVTIDEPLNDVLDSGVVTIGYVGSAGWLLGVQGASELELTTNLGGGVSSAFIDTAITTAAWVGDNSVDGKDGVSAQSFMRDLVESEVYGRFFYDPDQFMYVFHNRHRDAKATSAYTLTENDYEPGMSAFVKLPILNKSTVTFAPRTVGAAGAIIWSADEVPIEFGQELMKITARFRDPSNTSARIGATDVIQLVPGTDYIFIEPPTGFDITSLVQVSVSMKVGANSAEITLDGTKNPYPINITKLQIRGTPLTTFSQQSVTAANQDSQIAYAIGSEQVSYPLIDTANLAQNIADFRIYRSSEPIAAFTRIGWVLNKDSTRQSRGLAMFVGRRITISDSWMQHNADYIVVGFRHSITFGGEHTHEITCVLKPCERETFWILGTSTLGDNTRLGL